MTRARSAKKKPRTNGTTVLVGDIGGTSTRLALHDDGRAPIAEAVYPSREHASFEEIAERFLAENAASHPAAAVFGIAAPVRDGGAKLTNLPWRVDERVLARRLHVRSVELVNDLVAGARGALEVGPRSIAPLTMQRPARKGKNLAVIAAGTGLGEARLIWDGQRHLALPTEGGHCDFAPRSPVEDELLAFLRRRYPDHVSYERVVSGAGLGALYDFFAARVRRREPEAVTRRLAEGDRNAAICELGLTRAYKPAAQAVDLFAHVYGAEAGNLALRELSLGGVYVNGNIARAVVPARRELFLDGFVTKGRFAELLRTIPIAVVTDPLVGLRGALAIARESAAAA